MFVFKKILKNKTVLGLSVVVLAACQPKTDVRMVLNVPNINDTTPVLPKEILHGTNCGMDGRAEQILYYSSMASVENWAKKRRMTFESYDASQYQDAILVSRGVKPTGGHALHFIEGEYDVLTRDWNLKFNWINPAPDAMVTMAETYPCSVVIFPKSRPWQGVTLFDQQGRVHLRYQREGK